MLAFSLANVCVLMSRIKGWDDGSTQTVTKLNERQMLKGAQALFVEDKGCDGNHTLDETIILPLSLLPQLTLRPRWEHALH